MSGAYAAAAAKLFAAAGACLLPIAALTWSSSWPPWSWKRTHFADGEFGQGLLAVGVLFLIAAFVYFLFPRLLRRRLNNTLGQLHFWASLIGLFLQLALPILLNLAFRLRPGESKSQLFFRAFGAAMESTMLQLGAMAIPQVFLIANLVWSTVKGERIPNPSQPEARLSLS